MLDNEESIPEPSERLANDLSALYRTDVSIPRSMDEAILRDARQHFARQRSRRLILRIGALVTAAAAMIVIVIHLSHPPADRQAGEPPVAMNAVDSRRPVDIVDALKLARRIRAGQADRAHDDINHDGAVDQHDVDAIAMAAVKLPEARVQ
jgi:hypothetical protein